MKKLLLVLTIMFAFVTITFANTKTTSAKMVVKKEINLSPKNTTINTSQVCISVLDFKFWDYNSDGTVTEHHTVTVFIDGPCLLALIN